MEKQVYIAPASTNIMLETLHAFWIIHLLHLAFTVNLISPEDLLRGIWW